MDRKILTFNQVEGFMAKKKNNIIDFISKGREKGKGEEMGNIRLKIRDLHIIFLTSTIFDIKLQRLR